MGKLPVPNEVDLIFYAPHLAGVAGNTPGTVKSSLSGLAQYYMPLGVEGPTKGPRTGATRPRLARALRGVSRARTDVKRERLPLTTGLLKQVVKVLDKAGPEAGAATAAAVKAAPCAGVYGPPRISELVPGNASRYAVKDTRASGLHFYPPEKPKYMTIHVRSSKVGVPRRSTTIRIFATGAADCPVAAMLSWVAIRGLQPPGGPLFAFRPGTYLTRPKLTKALRDCLTKLGHRGASYASHSPRAGGAASLSAAGYGSGAPQLLGRWGSESSMILHLAASNRHARGAHQAMAAVTSEGITVADHEKYRNRYDG